MATRELKATVFYEAGELTYNFPFDYIKKRFVSIKYIDNFEADTLDAAENLEYGVDYTINDKVVTLKEAGDTSKYIYIYRSTPTEPIVDFSNSSFLTEENLDLSSLQQLHLNEEMSDYLILHKVPSGTLTEIRDVVESANQSSQNAQQSAEDALEAAQNANANAQSINIRTFPNVEGMKQSNNLKAGALAKTQGFYTAGDGGGADYVIKDTTNDYAPDEASIITLKNNLYAHLIIKDFLNVKQFGACGDGVSDDTDVLKNKIFLTDNHFLDNRTIYFPDGNYLISQTLETSTQYPRSIRMEKNARIFTNTNDLEYLIRLGRWGSGEKWNGSITGGILDANDKAKCCFGASSYNYFSYKDVICKNFKLYGVNTNPNELPSYWFVGNNMYFKNTTEWEGSTSIYCKNVDNFFTDVFSEGVQKGIYFRDKTIITNMHHWLLKESSLINGSCLAEIDNTEQGTKGAGSIFTRCYADTTQYAIKIINTQNTENSHVAVYTRDCNFSLANTDDSAIFVLNNGATITDIGSYFFTSNNINAKVVKADVTDFNNYTFITTTIAGNNTDNAFYNNWHRLKSINVDDANKAIYEGTYLLSPSGQNIPRAVNTMLEVVRSPQSWNNNQAYILQKAYVLNTDQTITLFVRYGTGFNNSIAFKKWTLIASWKEDA